MTISSPMLAPAPGTSTVPGPGANTGCANCPRYAHQWYGQVHAALAQPRHTQPTLFSADAEGGAA